MAKVCNEEGCSVEAVAKLVRELKLKKTELEVGRSPRNPRPRDPRGTDYHPTGLAYSRVTKSLTRAFRPQDGDRLLHVLITEFHKIVRAHRSFHGT